MVFQILLLCILCGVLIYATSLIISSIKTLARLSGLASFGLTAFVLAIATSLPELVVSIIASLEGNTGLILGNIIGSNIADLSLVIGGAAIFGGSLGVSGTILKRDIYLTGAAAVLPLFLIADQTLSRADGIVLLVVYLVMISTFLKVHQKSLASHALAITPVKRLFLAFSHKSGVKGIIKFISGVTLLLLASHFIVQLATNLAISSNLSNIFIGLFIVAVGTSLPELAFELKAVKSGEIKMALGDLLGSVVANATLILGIAALITPLKLTQRGLIPYTMAIGAFVSIYLAFIYFVRSKKRLERWEGLLLIIGYFIFMLFEVLNRGNS
jgi:cation:H+ antiporter